MKIKKIVAATMLATLVFTACGSDSSSSGSSSKASSSASSASSSAESSSAEVPAEIDINAVAEALKTEVKFDGEMTKLDDEVAKIMVEVPEGGQGMIYAIQGEQSADNFGVYKCADAGQVDTVIANINTYLNDNKDEMSKYKPEDVPKIENAIIKKSGNYAVFCVTADNAKAKEVIERFFK